jgi:hypothetical protein
MSMKITETEGYGWECPCGHYLWSRLFLLLVVKSWWHGLCHGNPGQRQ